MEETSVKRTLITLMMTFTSKYDQKHNVELIHQSILSIKCHLKKKKSPHALTKTSAS